MIKIIGISGSLRAGSYNTALLRASAELIKDLAVLEIVSINNIPLYNEDVENSEGIPQAVTSLQDKISSANGLILATPEYNHSIPGVLKNTIDWLSRPPGEISRVFNGRPVGVIGATMGGFGTVLAQSAWLPVLRRLGMQPWFGEQVMISKAHNIFDKFGEITDDAVHKQLEKFLNGFISFIESNDEN